MKDNEIAELALRIKEIQAQGIGLYSKLADEIVCDHIADPQRIELIMDGLMDFIYDEQYQSLYKRICMHVHQRHPQLVEEHIAMFKEQLALEGENEDQ